MSSSAVLILAGMVMLIGGGAWRTIAHMRATAAIKRAARDPRRWVRHAAVMTIGEQGLRRFARLLAERIRIEENPSVQEAIVQAIVRNQWEPADSPALVRLRLWAHQQLQIRPIGEAKDHPSWLELFDTPGQVGGQVNKEASAAEATIPPLRSRLSGR